MEDFVDGKWVLVIPPEGAARVAGEDVWKAMEGLLPPKNRKAFDTAKYLTTFDRLLKNSDVDMAVDLTGQSLVVEALDFEATHVLVIALSPVTFFTANLLNRRGIKILHWFIEDYRQAPYWKKVLPAYTHWFAIQRGVMEAACTEAKVRFQYLPTAAGNTGDSTLKPWTERKFDIAFVGLPSPYRTRVLEALSVAGFSLAVAGPEWHKTSAPLLPSVIRSGWVPPEDTQAILGEARLCVHVPYEDPAWDREGSHVSPRLYEALARGCGILCEESSLCREALSAFAPEFFSGPEMASEAARRLLERPPSPADLAFQHSAIKVKHGYRQRFLEMVRASRATWGTTGAGEFSEG